jgi:hypothetical protein
MSLTVKLSSIPTQVPRSAKVVGANHLYNIKNAGYSASTQSLFSEGANTCVLVALNAGKKSNCLLHLAPEHQKVGSIKEELSGCIDKLKAKCEDVREKVTGILFGGIEFDSKDPQAKGSFDVYNTVANSLEDMDVPFTMICGKKKGSPKDAIFLTSTSASLWNTDLKGLDIPQNASQEEIAKQLSSRYQFVEISPEVPISFEQ